jgi:cysteine desulfurase
MHRPRDLNAVASTTGIPTRFSTDALVFQLRRWHREAFFRVGLSPSTLRPITIVAPSRRLLSRAPEPTAIDRRHDDPPNPRQPLKQKTSQVARAVAISEPIYLDYQSTTPLDPRVLDAMLPYLLGSTGNPHSTSHLHGQTASRAVETARVEVAALVGAHPDEIVFTSGATEADNMLIRGAASKGRDAGRKAIVTCVTEHRAVLDVASRLSQTGHELLLISVDRDGFIDLSALKAAVTMDVSVVSVMAANNEIGVLQPIAAIAAICRQAGALFHCDAAQAVGKVAFDIDADGVDLASLSAHKLYGPMGIGAAVVTRAARRRIDPLMYGGGQENGLRSGTLPVALCVGFGAACRIAADERLSEAASLRSMATTFLAELSDRGVAFSVNGALDVRLPGNLNLRFAGVDAEALLMRIRPHVSISSGSACTAESLDPSHVLLALGHGIEAAEESVRIGFGRTTTMTEVRHAAETIARAVAGLARLSYSSPAKE